MSLFREDGHPVKALFDRFDAGEKLEGVEALAVLAAAFSDATHNNYMAKQLVQRVGEDSYRITLEKMPGS